MQRLRVKMTGTLPAANVDIDEKLDGFVNQLAFSYALPEHTSDGSGSGNMG